MNTRSPAANDKTSFLRCVQYWSQHESVKMKPDDLRICLAALIKTFPFDEDATLADTWAKVAGSIGLMRSVVTVRNRCRSSVDKRHVDDIHLTYLSLQARACKEELISAKRMRALHIGRNGRTSLKLPVEPRPYAMPTDNPQASCEPLRNAKSLGMRWRTKDSVKSLACYAMAHRALSSANCRALAGLIGVIVDAESIAPKVLSVTAKDEGPRRACQREFGEHTETGFGRRGRNSLTESIRSSVTDPKLLEIHKAFRDFGFMPEIDATQCVESTEHTGLVDFGRDSMRFRMDQRASKRHYDALLVRTRMNADRIERLDAREEQNRIDRQIAEIDWYTQHGTGMSTASPQDSRTPRPSAPTARRSAASYHRPA